MNVRVWNNYIDMTYGAIGAASPSLGPIYIWRNVYGVSCKDEKSDVNALRGHYLDRRCSPRVIRVARRVPTA